ncbi:hypothetical protein [Agromyces sp. NPDC049794]|uniref:hypothetical protein n=1 Tax=unclassified Agromyces TaxID=2639701 RepID=UPI003409F5B6
MTTAADAAAPCRHIGAPPAATVDRAAAVIKSLASHPDVLARYGISPNEFTSALPSAIESVRGSMSASNADRRQFLLSVLTHVVDRGLATSVTKPDYGDDTVYRLNVPSIGAVAIIQKGCPDGAHSSVRWTVPDWAQETYLWWLCPSLKAHPGEHIIKGVNRLRGKFFAEPDGRVLSGVIFHNDLCGTAQRPCPKQERAAEIDGQLVPAPCIYTMPERQKDANAWNWTGSRHVKFPAVLLQAFDIKAAEADTFTGFVGFQRKDNGVIRTTVATRFGAGRSSTYRS